MTELNINTHHTNEMIDITPQIKNICQEQNIHQGHVNIFIPHTTAAITINENADPDVVDDILKGLNQIIPEQGFKHAEGNSPAHIKSSMLGVSLTIQIINDSLALGTWQGVYFCEFDGPRNRKVWITTYKIT